MKHLVLAPLYPPVRYGGVEIISERLCAALAANDEVSVLAVTPTGAAVRHRWHNGVEVWEVPGHFFSPLSADSASSSILEVCRSNVGTPDVIHCHDWFLASAAVTLARRGVPLVGYFHTIKALERSSLGQPITAARRYSEEKQQLLADSADVVAVYSDFMREASKTAFGLEAHRVAQFQCGPTLPLATTRSSRPLTTGLRITYIGRLAAEKGVDLLVEAFGALSETEPHHSLRVIGAGPMAEAVIDRAQMSAGYPRIQFAPFMDDPQALLTEFDLSDLVVVPSRFEPYGLVAAEALALGVPVAVAETGGLPEIVDRGRFGALFPANDVEALREVLVEVAGDQTGAASRAAAGRHLHADPGMWRRAAQSIVNRTVGMYSEAGSSA